MKEELKVNDNNISISVIMSAYNEPVEFVEKAKNSILIQTFSA